jgi:DNA-binding winged helix-turn-helix (wHTH) protein
MQQTFQENPITYRFGPFMLDTAHRLLLSGSEVKPLPEKLFRILVLLLEAGGKTIPKDAFFSQVWGDESISDANLTQHIFMLRQTLGERAGDNAYIVTVAGEGYRFAVPIEAKIGLTMKGSCEACCAVLPADGVAFICSFECTFCGDCAAAREQRCPNCAGELVRRPMRRSS